MFLSVSLYRFYCHICCAEHGTKRSKNICIQSFLYLIQMSIFTNPSPNVFHSTQLNTNTNSHDVAIIPPSNIRDFRKQKYIIISNLSFRLYELIYINQTFTTFDSVDKGKCRLKPVYFACSAWKVPGPVTTPLVLIMI
jgi:hypothetical protein